MCTSYPVCTVRRHYEQWYAPCKSIPKMHMWALKFGHKSCMLKNIFKQNLTGVPAFQGPIITMDGCHDNILPKS